MFPEKNKLYKQKQAIGLQRRREVYWLLPVCRLGVWSTAVSIGQSFVLTLSCVLGLQRKQNKCSSSQATSSPKSSAVVNGARYPDGTVCIWTGVHLECSPIIHWCWLKCKHNPSTAFLLCDFHPGPGCHLFPGPLQQTQWLFLASLLLPQLTHLLLRVYEKLNQYNTSAKNFPVSSYCPWNQMPISQLWPHRWRRWADIPSSASCPVPALSCSTRFHAVPPAWEPLSAVTCSRTRDTSPRPWSLPSCSWGMSSRIPSFSIPALLILQCILLHFMKFHRTYPYLESTYS